MRSMRTITVAFMAMLLITGCASFSKNEIARIEKMPDVSRYKKIPSVYVDFKFFSGDPSKEGVENGMAREHLLPAVEAAVKSTQLFSKVTFDEFQKRDVDYTIELHCYNHGDSGAAAALGAISGLTLGVIPAKATDNYTLKVKLLDRRQRKVDSYDNHDAVDTWIGIWFIPMMGNSPQKVVGETLENQIRDALKHLVEQKKIKYSLYDLRKDTGFI